MTFIVNKLITGNCVMMKPSEISENVASLLDELFPKYFDTVSKTVILTRQIALKISAPNLVIIMTRCSCKTITIAIELCSF